MKPFAYKGPVGPHRQVGNAFFTLLHVSVNHLPCACVIKVCGMHFVYVPASREGRRLWAVDR